ncbi:hypothetical protein evm_015230, partial [Chilo suppressalis]
QGPCVDWGFFLRNCKNTNVWKRRSRNGVSVFILLQNICFDLINEFWLYKLDVTIDISNCIDSPVHSGCEQEIKFLLQLEAEYFLELNNNDDLPDHFVTIEEETEHKNKEKDIQVQEKSNDVQLSPLNNVVELPIAEEIIAQEKRVEVQRQNCILSSPKNILEGPEVLEDEIILSEAANTTIDCPE